MDWNYGLGICLISGALLLCIYQMKNQSTQSRSTRIYFWSRLIPAVLSAIVIAVMLFLGLIRPFE